MAKVGRTLVFIALVLALTAALSVPSVKRCAGTGVGTAGGPVQAHRPSPAASTATLFATYSDHQHLVIFDRGRFEYAPQRAYRNLVRRTRADGPRVEALSYELERATAGRTTLFERGSQAYPLTAEGDTYWMRKGGLVEKYVVRPDGVEQLFVIDRLAERGAIKVTGRLCSNVPLARADERGIVFGRMGRDLLFYRDAVAYDARGERTFVPMHYDDGRVTLWVPEDFVRRAELPITVDPLIGSPVQVDAGFSSTFVWRPLDVAGDGAGGYLIVWCEAVTDSTGAVTDGNVYAQRVDAAGALVGTQINVANGPDIEALAAVAFGAGEYLVCWAHRDPTTAIYNLKVRTVNATTGGLGAVQALEPTPTLHQISPHVAWDGSKFLVVWEQMVTATNFDIAMKTVDATGVPGILLNVDSSAEDQALPQVGVIPGTTSALVAWMHSVGGTPDIYARRIDTSGPTTVGGSVEVFNDATNHDYFPNPVGNSDNNEWLICWESVNPAGPGGTTPGDVMARRMLADGTLQPVFTIQGDANDNTYPRGVWSDTNNEYFVTYHDKGSGNYDVLAAKVAGGADTVSGPSIPIAGAAQDEVYQGVALNPSDNLAVIGYMLYNGGWEIWLQRYDLDEAAAPPTSGGGTSGGGTAGSGTTGGGTSGGGTSGGTSGGGSTGGGTSGGSSGSGSAASGGAPSPFSDGSDHRRFCGLAVAGGGGLLPPSSGGALLACLLIALCLGVRRKTREIA